MKRFLMYSALALAVVLGGATAYAQTSGPGGGNGQHQPPSPEQRVKMLTQQLNLTNDQQQNIKLILEDESNRMESLRSDSSLTQQERRSKVQEIRQNTKTQMNSILTQEQQTQLQQAQLQQAQSQQTTDQHNGGRPNKSQPQ